MPIALDRSPRYFASEILSENIAKTDEGYLICRNVVIGRSGFQTYQVSEIQDPEGLLKAAGYLPHQSIELWRDPVEVFSEATLSSFEGKTFTLSHPDELLDPDTEREHHEGHVQNIRRGTKPLDSGDIPMLGDLLITGPDAIQSIDGGERELSCGYRYRLARGPNGWEQRDIRGNHVALVQRARAGSEARINDSAPAPKENPVAPVKDFFKHIFGIGFAAYAKDAKPEELSEALDALRTEPASGKTNNTAKDTAERKSHFVKIGTTSDGVDIFKSVATDAEPEEKKTEKKEEGKDDKGMDSRKRMHDMLDKMMDMSEEEKKAKSEQDDADMKELRGIIGDAMGEEEEKPKGEDAAHPEGCRCADCMDKAKDEEAEVVKETADDEAEIVRAEPVLSPEERPESVFDEAKIRAIVAESTLQVLKGLRPFVAHANDKKLSAAFDVAITRVQAATKTTAKDKAKSAGAGYSKFRVAASTAKDAADSEYKPKESGQEKEMREHDALYNKKRIETSLKNAERISRR